MSIRCCCTAGGCCPGATIATTLFLVPNAGAGGAYVPATLTFATTSPIGRGGSGWWSTLQTDPVFGLHYWYQVIPCFSVNIYVIQAGNPTNGYPWSPTRAGNSCSPLLLIGASTTVMFSFISFTEFNFGNFTLHD
jgi:hypothetical protein